MRIDILPPMLPYLLSGTLGLAGAAALSSAALMAYRTWVRQAILTDALANLLFASFLIISIVEIPLMLVALRRIARERNSPWAPIALNFAFVMTAGVYGSLYLLFTGRTTEALFLSGLSLVRFLSSLIFGRPT